MMLWQNYKAERHAIINDKQVINKVDYVFPLNVKRIFALFDDKYPHLFQNIFQDGRNS